MVFSIFSLWKDKQTSIMMDISLYPVLNIYGQLNHNGLALVVSYQCWFSFYVAGIHTQNLPCSFWVASGGHGVEGGCEEGGRIWVVYQEGIV